MDDRPRTTAGQLLWRLHVSLAEEAHKNARWPTLLLRKTASLAVLVPAPTVIDSIARLLNEAPEDAFLAGVITNITDRSCFVKRNMPSFEEACSRFPLYPAGELPPPVQRATDPHIVAARARDIALAISCADSDLSLEEVASTCAVVGDVPSCLEIVRRPGYPHARRDGPRMVACVESHRRGDFASAEQILGELAEADALHGWNLLHLAAGLLGRVPWGGYPYPDY